VPTFEHDGISLAYDDTGGDRPPIVFLHGLSMSRDSWLRFVPELEDRFRVLRLDQRGHGESSRAPGTYVLDTYLADTVAFLEDVVRGPSIVVGHSLGGVIAHGVTQTRPDLVRAALLEDPPLYVVERMNDGATREQASAVASMFPIIQNLCREMQARHAPIEEYEAMVAAVPAMNGAGTMADVIGAQGARAMAEAFSRLDPEIFTPAIDGSAISGTPDLSARLARPVTVVRADPALGAAFGADDEPRFLETNPHARVVMFEGASHAVHDEQPARFLEEVLAVARAAHEEVSSS
jgi:pimeloyl-ACP methyl ester carboxylesterase